MKEITSPRLSGLWWRMMTEMVLSVVLLLLCRGPVYFYTVGSSIGSSPHPCHWLRMIDKFGQNFGEAQLCYIPAPAPVFV